MAAAAILDLASLLKTLKGDKMRRFTKRLSDLGKYTYMYSKRLQLLNLPSLELRRLYFDLTWAYKIIFGYVDMCSDFFFELSSTKTTRGHPYKLFKRQCTGTVRSSFFYWTGC